MRQFVNVGQAGFDPFDPLANLMRVAREFLTQRQWCCVLGVGPADLDDVFEFFRFRLKRSRQFVETGQQNITRLKTDAHVHRGGERVVRRLAHVAVVVGVNRGLGPHHAAQNFNRAVRDDLVRVHVRLGTGTCLPNNQREVVIEFAVDHFLRGLADRVADFGLHVAEFDVCLGAGLFDSAEGADDRNRLAFPSDGEVDDRTLCLCAPVFVCGDFKRAKAVRLGAGCGHLALLSVCDCMPFIGATKNVQRKAGGSLL